MKLIFTININDKIAHEKVEDEQENIVELHELIERIIGMTLTGYELSYEYTREDDE